MHTPDGVMKWKTHSIEELIVNDVRIPKQGVARQFCIIFEISSIFWTQTSLLKRYLAMLSHVRG